MRIFALLSAWVRTNAEHYLLQDAQRQTAATYGVAGHAGPRSLKDRFWRQVFVPVYRLLPWGIRSRIMQAMPGSHRRSWPKPNYDRRPPGI